MKSVVIISFALGLVGMMTGCSSEDNANQMNRRTDATVAGAADAGKEEGASDSTTRPREVDAASVEQAVVDAIGENGLPTVGFGELICEYVGFEPETKQWAVD